MAAYRRHVGRGRLRLLRHRPGRQDRDRSLPARDSRGASDARPRSADSLRRIATVTLTAWAVSGYATYHGESDRATGEDAALASRGVRAPRGPRDIHRRATRVAGRTAHRRGAPR